MVADQLKELALERRVGVPLALVLYWLLRTFPDGGGC